MKNFDQLINVCLRQLNSIFFGKSKSFFRKKENLPKSGAKFWLKTIRKVVW